MTDWYYSDYERNRHGPVSANDLAQLHAKGQLSADTLVWREGLAQWQAWHTLADEILGQQQRSDGTRAEFSSPADAATRSPYSPPSAPLLQAETLYRDHEVVYAGFWKRAAASIVDGILISIIGAAVGAMIGGGMAPALDLTNPRSFWLIQGVAQLVSLAINVTYYAWFHASSNQATPGKMAIGIKVVRSNGEGISFLRGVARYFALIPSALILGIGFLMAGFTERKQALHDMICDTLVVDKWAFTAHPEQQRRSLGTAATVILALGALLFLGTVAVIVGIGAMYGAGS